MFRKLLVLLVLVAGAGCTGTPDRSSELQSQLMSLESRVDTLQQSLDQEEQARAEQFALLSQDLDALKDTIPSSPATVQPQPEKAGQEQAEARKSAPVPGQTTDETASTTSKPSPEAKYRRALNTLLSGSSSEAQDMFQSFLEAHPESDLAPNATYWLGEAHYVQKRFAQSILFFKEVSNTYPDDQKAADALLKMGYAYANLGQTDNARFYLQRLVEHYPASHSARLAKERLQTLP